MGADRENREEFNMQNIKCKICRRLGVKLFLKGDRCMSPKCAMIRKAYPPGGKKAGRRRQSISEYGKELKEKQKLKNWYNLQEKQFRNYVKEILKKKNIEEDAAAFLVKKLEQRLDNVIFRLGFASSRAQARQLINHRHFLVNNKIVNLPSYQVRKDDKISIRSSSVKKNFFQNFSTILKKYQPPSWLKLDSEKLEGKVIDKPNLEETSPPAEISTIFEYYSK